MKGLLLLVVGLTGACGSVDSEAGRVPQRIVLDYSIDVTFSEPQAESIRMGLEFWRSELTNVDFVETERVRCTVETPRCFVAVGAKDPSLWDAEHARFASGQFHGSNDSISINKDLRMSALPILTAHEFGHRLGLRHDESVDGVMNAEMGEETPWELTDSATALLSSLGFM